MSDILNDPGFVSSLLAVVVTVALLGTLYILLPRTLRSKQLRNIVRFGIIWAVGGLGTQSARTFDDNILGPVSHIVSLIGMVAMAALWPHLAKISVIETWTLNLKKRREHQQITLYIISMAFLILGSVIYYEEGLLPFGYLQVFQAYLIICLIYAVVLLMGQGWKETPRIEKRSRTMVAAGAMVFSLFIINDLILGLMVGRNMDLSSMLLPIPLCIAGWGLISRRRFTVEAKITHGAKKFRSKGPIKDFSVRSGRMYYELDRPGTTLPQLLKNQISRDRVVLVVTGREASSLKDLLGLEDLPIIRYATQDEDADPIIDPSVPEDLQMLKFLFNEFASDASEIKGSKGALVVIEGFHLLSKRAGPKATKGLLKGLRGSVRRSEMLSLIILGKKRAFKKLARSVEKTAFPLRY